MKVIDVIIIVFCAFLILKGVKKGFVKEVAGILAVVVALIASFLFHEPIENVLSSFTSSVSIPLVAYIATFVAVYFLIILLGGLLDKILKSIFLGGVNRLLGGVFGAIKSVLWLTMLTYAYTVAKDGVGFEHPSWVQDSSFFPFLVDFSEILSGYLA